MQGAPQKTTAVNFINSFLSVCMTNVFLILGLGPFFYEIDKGFWDLGGGGCQKIRIQRVGNGGVKTLKKKFHSDVSECRNSVSKVLKI